MIFDYIYYTTYCGMLTAQLGDMWIFALLCSGLVLILSLVNPPTLTVSTSP
jgi:hypothetical protein